MSPMSGRERRPIGPGGARQRGFALLVVLLIIVLMAGAASVTLLASQVDLRIAGEDVASTGAFYAAETAVAFGTDWLRAQAPPLGGGAWTAILASGDPHLCAANPQQPGLPWITPSLPAVPFDPSRGTAWVFCVHNNALDPVFATGVPAPNTVDSDGLIAIEGYGYGPNGQISRVTVELGVAGVPTVISDYAQSGGNALKQAHGDNRSVAVTTGSTSY